MKECITGLLLSLLSNAGFGSVVALQCAPTTVSFLDTKKHSTFPKASLAKTIGSDSQAETSAIASSWSSLRVRLRLMWINRIFSKTLCNSRKKMLMNTSLKGSDLTLRHYG